MGDLGTGIFEGGDEGVLVTGSRAARAGRATACATLAVDTGVPLTIGIIATNPGGYEMLDLIDAVAAVGGPDDRPVALPRHQRPALVRDPAAVRSPARVAGGRAPCPPRNSGARCATRRVRERLVAAAMHGDYGRWRGIGAMPRRPDFDGIRVYQHGLPPNPTVNEVAAARRGVARSRR